MRSELALTVLVVATAGCGRVGFDPHGDGGGGAIDAPPGAITVSFGETGTATYSGVTRDTFIVFGGGSNLNYGTSVILGVDTSPGAVSLLRFDVSAIPVGATVVSASVALTPVSVGSSGGMGFYWIREPWDEGSSNGTAGIANWDERLPGAPWSSAGCTPPSRDQGSFGLGSAQTAGQTMTATLDNAKVQAWVDDPASNVGMALVASSLAANYASREAAAMPDRPVLTITYVL